MEDQQSEWAYKKPLIGIAIVVMNLIGVIIYINMVIKSNLFNSVGTILFIHILVCVVFAIRLKSAAWWVSAGIVAFPFISLLIHG